MNVQAEAIICAVRPHGEHATVVRMLTAEHGLVAAYVRGGRGRRMRPVLIPGNVVAVQLRSRTEAQLPQATVELSVSRGAMLAEPLPASAIHWATALVTAALPERQPYPRLHEALSGLLSAIEAAPSASGWGAALARFELLLLAELGYGQSDSLFPPGLGAGRRLGWPAILEALGVSGGYLFRDVLTQRSSALEDARARLVERLRRASA